MRRERAAIWKMKFDGTGMMLVAEHIRNAIALEVDPQTGHLWAGGAGQDEASRIRATGVIYRVRP